MADRLILERLEFDGYCGIVDSERLHPQPMAVDLELTLDMTQAAATDDLARTVDYAQVAGDIVSIAQSERFHLVETLAERLADAVLSKYPIRGLTLWVRKLAPPLKYVRGSVGARIVRDAAGSGNTHAPAQWLLEHRHLLTYGKTLDVASGRGRNTIYLAQEGFSVDAWDRDADSLRELEQKAGSLGLT